MAFLIGYRIFLSLISFHRLDNILPPSRYIKSLKKNRFVISDLKERKRKLGWSILFFSSRGNTCPWKSSVPMLAPLFQPERKKSSRISSVKVTPGHELPTQKDSSSSAIFPSTRPDFLSPSACTRKELMAVRRKLMHPRVAYT